MYHLVLLGVRANSYVWDLEFVEISQDSVRLAIQLPLNRYYCEYHITLSLL